jgi:hypothetical protein
VKRIRIGSWVRWAGSLARAAARRLLKAPESQVTTPTLPALDLLIERLRDEAREERLRRRWWPARDFPRGWGWA